MKKNVIAILAFGIFSFLSPAMAQDSEVTVSTKGYGDWQVRCEQVKGQSKTCVMSQQALVQNSGQRLMQVNIGETDDGKQMTIILPLGISLPAGAALHLSEDNVKPLVIGFCTQAGCFVNQKLDKNLSDAIAAQESVNVSIETNDGKAIDVPVSSNGFGDALKAL